MMLDDVLSGKIQCFDLETKSVIKVPFEEAKHYGSNGCSQSLKVTTFTYGGVEIFISTIFLCMGYSSNQFETYVSGFKDLSDVVSRTHTYDEAISFHDAFIEQMLSELNDEYFISNNLSSFDP